MHVSSVAAVREMEQKAITSGIPEYELMCRAGIQAAVWLDRKFPAASRFVVLSGGGNNGGDALVAAAHLSHRDVVIFSTKEKSAYFGCAANAVADLPENIPFYVRKELNKFDFRSGDVIVDGLLGIGYHGRRLRSEVESFIKAANESCLPIAALDLPSGIDGDSGIAAENGAIKAYCTLTFGRAKKGLFSGDGALLRGMLRVLDIGLEESENCGKEIFCNLDAVGSIPRFSPDCHKNSRGRVMFWGGSPEYPGAGVLSVCSALKSGAGIVRAASEADLRDRLPDAAIFSKLAADQIPEEMFSQSDVLICGCGWGSSGTEKKLYAAWNFPGKLVLDADGLNMLARYPWIWHPRKNVVITPHPGEAVRLAKAFGIEYELLEREEFAVKLAEKLQVAVILKGRDSVAASPDGRKMIIASGNAFLATAGSGDILAGTLGAFLSNGMMVFEAAALAAYIHGVAGEIAGKIIIADELPDLISRTIASFSENQII